MVARERAHGQIESSSRHVPSCRPGAVRFLTAHGNLSKYDWLHLKTQVAFLGGEIGNPIDPYFAKFGVPAAVGKEFEAQCKCR